MRNQRIAAFSATLALASAALAWAAPGDVFPAGAVAERLYHEGRFTEAVDVAPDGSVYFSDLAVPGLGGEAASRTLRFDPATGRTAVVVPSNGNTNGIKFRPDGRMLSVQASFGGSRDVVETSPRTGARRVVARGYEGRPFNSLNDLVLDRSGRAYVTDVRYVGTEPIEQPVNGVYRIAPDGTVTRVVSDMLAPNGIALSPDGRTLYVAEHPYRSRNLLEGDRTMLPMSIRAYRVAPDGRVSDPRTVVDFGVREGADGMVVDHRGRLLVAYRDDERRGVRVFTPAGSETDFLPLAEKPTNVAFGRGREAGVLYITAGRSLYRVATRTRGWRP